MPSIFGMFNIRILINDNILKLSNDEVKYIFLHELAHYKRKDNILNVLITVLRCIYFFNPIIWILLNEVKNDLEVATDELAMAKENTELQKEYSKTLVKMSVIDSDKFLIQTMCLSDSKKNLEKRIDNIKLIDRFRRNRKVITIIAIIVISVIIGIFYTGNVRYMSAKDISKLYHKAGNYDNIHYVKECTYYYPNKDERNITYEEYYFKNNIVSKKCTDENGEMLSITYIDYNNNEGISIYNYDNDKVILINDISNVEEKNRQSKFGNWYSKAQIYDDCYDDNKEYFCTYEYLGKEYINGRETYKYKETLTNEYTYSEGIIWVDKETGVILKTESHSTSKNRFENEVTRTENYWYEYNNVKDEDIKRPDLEKYSDYEITNQVYYSPYY